MATARKIIIWGALLRRTSSSRPTRAHPSDRLPNLQFMVHVDASRSPYFAQVWVNNWPKTSQLSVEIRPTFAWDALEYAKVAGAALGDTKATTPDPDADKILADLLEPTGAKLAAEDVRLSARLQANPLDPAAHEEAALVLLSMALREKASQYTDPRLFICRATAHLALADALTNAANLSGTTASPMERCASSPDARRMRRQSLMISRTRRTAPLRRKAGSRRSKSGIREDVTGVTVTAASSRLVKIAWFQTLMENLPPLSAVAQLDQLGKPDAIVDWSRSVLNNGMPPVEIGNRFDLSSMEIEYQELKEILAAEQAPDLTRAISTRFSPSRKRKPSPPMPRDTRRFTSSVSALSRRPRAVIFLIPSSGRTTGSPSCRAIRKAPRLSVGRRSSSTRACLSSNCRSRPSALLMVHPC